MANNPLALLTILGMAAMAYATRAGGFWLMGRVTPTPRVEAWLRALPGAVLISIVAPLVLNGGLVEKLGALVTVLATALFHNILLAVCLGVGIVCLLRLFI
jgi:uncharacterized membrane protein